MSFQIADQPLDRSGALGGGRPNASGSTSTAIADWVAATFTARTVDGVVVYDLSAGVS